MPLHSDLQRNGAGYFFSREVPVELRSFIPETRIIRDLDTSEVEEARRRCWTVGLHVDRLFEAMRLEASRISTEAQRFLWRWRLMPVGAIARDWADLWFRATLDTVAPTRRPWDAPAVADTPEVAAPTEPPSPIAAASDAVTLSMAFERWQQEYAPTRSYPDRFIVPVRRFIEFHGDCPVADVKPAHLWRFLEALQKMPARALRGMRGQTMHAILENPKAADKPKLSALTVTYYRSVLGMFFQWTVTFGHIDENPVAKLLKRKRLPVYEPRRPFDSNDLKRIFTAPIYSGSRSINQRMVRGDFVLRDFIFWMPLLALFTGARESELVWLLVNDVGEAGEISYLNICLNGTGRQLKTQAAIRMIPIHPLLIRCGFLEFVNGRRSQPDALLFEEIKMYGSIARIRVAHKLNEVIRSAGVTDSRKTFYSFRHTFKRACRAADIEEEIHDALTGHAPRTAGRRYGMQYPLEVLDRAMKRIEFPGLDLQYLLKQ